MSILISKSSSGLLEKYNSLECTCEFNKTKLIWKKSIRYSMCDICSEKLFVTIQNNIKNYNLDNK